MNISQIRNIVKQRPLTPKELAILFLWDQTNGNVSNYSRSLSEAVIDFHYVFSNKELDEIVKSSEPDEDNEYIKWERLIETTKKYDTAGLYYFQRYLSLLNELSLFYKNNLQPIFSITLHQQAGYKELSYEITNSIFNYFKFLIAILINQYFLSNAFDNLKDLLTIKSLEDLYKMKISANNIEDIRSNHFFTLIEVLFQNFFKQTFSDYLIIIQYNHTFINIKNNEVPLIEKYIKRTINQHYQGTFIIESEVEPIFE